MNVYYNDNDPFCCKWLDELVTRGRLSAGEVSGLNIRNLTRHDVQTHKQCHFFCGIGGWPLALQIAEWPNEKEVWTGSCPCQPFSSAGRRKGTADERHLWPDWFRLIRECRPATIFGEQVASAIGHGWLDLVFADLESEGYACGAAVLGAHSVGAPHMRNRLFWGATLADKSNRSTDPGRGTAQRRRQDRTAFGAAGEVSGPAQERERSGANSGSRGENDGLANSNSARQPQSAPGETGSKCARHGIAFDGSVSAYVEFTNRNGRPSGNSTVTTAGHGPANESAGVLGQLGHAGQARRTARSPQREECSDSIEPVFGAGVEADYLLAYCSDGKLRPISTQYGDQPLAYGIPWRTSDERLGYLLAELQRLGHSPVSARSILRRARQNRVGQLKGYGNAIVPQVAAEFVMGFMECMT